MIPVPTPTAPSRHAGASELGWYGKLPVVGDFVGRRLPQGFIDRWDHWLQRGLALGEERFGERWQELYLTFPVWRFLVPAGAGGGACGGTGTGTGAVTGAGVGVGAGTVGAWYGILLPSVDRVGRFFPLTICRPVASPAVEALPGLGQIDDELTRCARAGLEAIDGIPVDAFDRMLVEISAAAPKETLPEDSGASLIDAFVDPLREGCWPLGSPLADALSVSAECLAVTRLGNRSLWWLPPDGERAGTMRLGGSPLAGDPPAELLLLLIADA